MVLVDRPGSGWSGSSVVARICYQHCYQVVSGSGLVKSLRYAEGSLRELSYAARACAQQGTRLFCHVFVLPDIDPNTQVVCFALNPSHPMTPFVAQCNVRSTPCGTGVNPS